MDIKIADDWKQVLSEEFTQPYFENLVQFVKTEYRTQTVYPKGNQIFRAFDSCRLHDVKVLILGQDPYHAPGLANGLSFSVNNGVALPPSLRNIFQEVAVDTGQLASHDGNLERWARQGVLLLNATLTVRSREAGSHQNRGWEKFTDAVIKALSTHRDSVVYMLWGAYAQKKSDLIGADKNLILKAAHPSPLSAHRGFIGCSHFKMANEYFKKKDLEPIKW